jgi:hypothetical protein
LTKVLTVHGRAGRTRQAGNVFKGAGGVKRDVAFERLRQEAGPSLEGVALVVGHFPLGLRQRLTEDRELRCFTFLREPSDRILSHYFAVREQPAQSRGKYALSPLPADPSIDDMVAAGYIHDNLQTRMLCGDPEPFGEVTGEMLEAAKRNLRDELVFFGLTERFDESLVLAKRRLGLRGILYRSSRRVNPARPREDEIPAGLRHAAERCNRYDIELYRHAQELFDSAPELTELEFEVELAAFRAAMADSEAEAKVPAPDGFTGDEDAWRMLLQACVTVLRYEHGTAELYRYAQELFDSVPELRELEFQVEPAALRAATADSEAEAKVPPPDGFVGDEAAWRMLLQACVTVLRYERGTAEVESKLREQLDRVEDVKSQLA